MKILALIFIVCFYINATPILGTNIGAPIVPPGTTDQIGTHYSGYGIGGWREVADTNARNAITNLRRTNGMIVHCIAENRDYRLIEDITGPSWRLIPIQFNLYDISTPSFALIDEDDGYASPKTFRFDIPSGNNFTLAYGTSSFGFNNTGDAFVRSNLYVELEAPKLVLNGDTVKGDYFDLTGAWSRFTSTNMYNSGSYYSIGNIFLGDTTAYSPFPFYVGAMGTIADTDTDSLMIAFTSCRTGSSERGSRLVLGGNESAIKGVASLQGGDSGDVSIDAARGRNAVATGTNVYINVHDTTTNDIPDLKIGRDSIDLLDQNRVAIYPSRSDSAILRIGGASPNPGGTTRAAIEWNRGTLNMFGDTVFIDNLRTPGLNVNGRIISRSLVTDSLLINISALVGSPTSGSMGNGTLNAQGLYVNGVAVLTEREQLVYVFDNMPNYAGGTVTNASETVYQGGGVCTINESASGIDCIVSMYNVPRFDGVEIIAGYVGATTHRVTYSVRNFYTQTWDCFGTIKHDGDIDTTASTRTINNYSFPIHDMSKYDSLGIVKIRFLHYGSGITSHRLYIDHIALYGY